MALSSHASSPTTMALPMLGKQVGPNISDLACSYRRLCRARWRHDDTVPVEMLIKGRCRMDNRTDAGRRLDLHNISIDFAAASAGRCGFTHLDSGRVRQLPTATTALASCKTSAATLSA